MGVWVAVWVWACLWAWVPGCECQLLQCGTCVRGINELTCPDLFDSSRITLKVEDHRTKPDSVLKIQCRSTSQHLNVSWLQGCSFPVVRYVRFRYCPMPTVPFSEVLQEMGVTPEALVTLSFSDAQLRVNQTLRSDHLRGLIALKNLEFKGNLFTDLPVDLFEDNSHLEYIGFSFNKFEVLPEEIFANTPNLTELTLRDNGLTSIPDNLLANLTNLTDLSLYDNLLTEMPPKVLSHVPALQKLELSFNKISQLDSKVFANLPNLTKLLLNFNKIQELPQDLLHNCPNVEIFYITYNQLTHFPSTLFRESKNVREFYFDNNRVTDLPEGIFRGLSNMTKLKLKRNGLKSFPPNTFRDLVNLEVLDLQSNLISVLPLGCFDSQYKMDTLILHNNTLSELPRDIFKHCESLERLHLGLNNLETLKASSFPHPITVLHTLDLSHNNLSFTTHTPNPSNTRFNPSNTQSNPSNTNSNPSNSESDSNNEYNTSNNDFNTKFNPSNSESESNIDFNTSNNKSDQINNESESNNEYNTSNIDFNTSNTKFDPSNSEPDPSNTSSIDFNTSNTKFDPSNTSSIDYSTSNIEHDPSNIEFQQHFPLSSQSNLVDLKLDYNQIRRIPRALTTDFPELSAINLQGNIIDFVEGADLYFKHGSVRLDLKGNQIKTIDIGEVDKLLTGDLVQVEISGNPLICNCHLYHLIKLIQREYINPSSQPPFVKDYFSAKCTWDNGVQQSLLGVDVHSLSCPAVNCIDLCSCITRPHDKMFVMDCSYRGLQEVPTLHNLTSNELSATLTMTLNLKGNNISSLSGLEKYTSLINLTAANNILPSIKKSFLPKSLRTLDLRRNRFTSVHQSVLEFFNKTQTTLSLGGNPWICDCDLLPLFAFIRDPDRNVTDAASMGCQDLDVPLVKAMKEDLCPLIKQPRVIIAIASTTILLFIILVCVTVGIHRYQHDIKVWLFTHRLFLWAIAEEEEGSNKKYDAFISYSNEDDEFVNLKLVPGLESGEPKYKVCLHYRDWVPGEYIQNQIDESIEASRRTIVVLSKNFIENVWGQIEFKTAHSKALKDKANRIIVIVYGEVPPESQMDDELKLYLSTRTYLKYRDPKFWEKLRYAMPHPPEFVYRRQKYLKKDRVELRQVNSKPITRY